VTFEVHEGHVVPDAARVRPGEVTIKLANKSDEAEIVVGVARFEREDDKNDETESAEATADDEPWMEWTPMLSGKKLLSTQSFRDLFRAESLAPDASLELQSLAIVFTDLKASTQLYERVGDLRALDLVREHFKLLHDVIDEEEGAIVKTIGDAVMATFVDPQRAVRAGARMHRALAKLAGPEELALKVGVHQGACVAIDSNARLDYFGQTVNIAARVQGIAEGREIVCTDAVFASPGVAKTIGELAIAMQREETVLKGIDKPVVVHRGVVR
jgi:class 3 adenylate cyclase